MFTTKYQVAGDFLAWAAEEAGNNSGAGDRLTLPANARACESFVEIAVQLLQDESADLNGRIGAAQLIALNGPVLRRRLGGRRLADACEILSRFRGDQRCNEYRPDIQSAEDEPLCLGQVVAEAIAAITVPEACAVVGV